MSGRRSPCGTRTRYQTGCRCEPCTAAARTYAAAYRARQRAAGYVYVRGQKRPNNWKETDQ